MEAFSYGVFAIVITHHAFDLKRPDLGPDASLASALWDQWPAYLAYFVGFLQIGVMWLNHHRVFQQVRAVDGVLLVLNLNLLMWVVLVPFPTAVVADHLRDGGQNATTAMALFTAVLVANAISFVALFAWITHDERLAGSLPSPATIRTARIRFGVGLGAYLGSFMLSFVAPVVALVVCGIVALYYAFDQATVANQAPT